MTGPEHYEEAELLLERSAAGSNPGSVARAQVHATLALAAVTAISDPALGLPAEVRVDRDVPFNQIKHRG